MVNQDTNDVVRAESRVYRVSKGWKIFLSIGAPLMALGSLALMAAPFWVEKPLQIGFVIFFLLLGGAFFLLSLFGLIDAFKTRVEIYPDRIKKVAIFKTQELFIEEIEGYKCLVGKNTELQILPKEKQEKVMSISLILERKDEIVEWCQAKLADLDAIELREEIKQARNDPALGDTEEERFLALGWARLGARFLNGLAIIVAIWALFWPQPYNIVIGALILLPWAAIGAVRFFRGALKFEGDTNDVYPNVTYAIMAPAGVLALRAMLDWAIIDYGKLWLPCLAVAGALFALALSHYKEMKKQPVIAFGVLFICAIYGYGVLLSLNGLMDESTVMIHEAQVVDKRLSESDRTSYYLKLAPWGERIETAEVDVGEDVYGKYQAGDTARVYVGQGRFGISWFVVD
ncbi:MAG: hypothetical protein KAS94_00945 [Desulfobulbaceae bacterium]|nr:hypothetical protein [Desulfobulbaceae bacterium]